MKKADLIEQARIRGVVLPEDEKLTNKRIEQLIGIDYYEKHPEVRSWGLKRRLFDLHTPQLCFQFKELKPSEQEHLLKSEDWLGETKIDGFRCLAFYSPEYGFEFFGRDISELTFLPSNYSDKILLIKDGIVRKPSSYRGLFKQSFILDGEVLVANKTLDTTNQGGGFSTTELNATVSILGSSPERALSIQMEGNPLRFFMFDCLEFGDLNLMDKPLRDRRKYLMKLIDALKDKVPFNIPESTVTDKQIFFDKIVAEGGEGCFKGSTNVMMADGSSKFIKDVGVGDYVLSYNTKSKILESKRVLNIYDNGLKPITSWISTSHGGNQKGTSSSRCNYYKRIVSTKNHKFFSGDGKYLDIDSLDYCYELNPTMDEFRRQALRGWIVSDGCVGKDGILTLSQKYDSPYWKYTRKIFREFFNYNKDSYRYSGKGTKMGTLGIYKRYCSEFINHRYDLGYEDIFSEMDEIAWAYAFMGDGSLEKRRSCCFNFQSMTESDIDSAVASLKKVFGINKVSLHKDKRVNGYGISIRLNAENTERLFNGIVSYVHPSMMYKFGDRLQETFKEPPKVELGISKVNLAKHNVSDEKTYSSPYSTTKNIRAWDIEVEDNNNYFVEGVLVHNCVLKNLDEQYYATTSRKRCVQVKMKRNLSDVNNEDIDCFISGSILPKKNSALWVENLIGGIKVSVFLQEEDGTETEHWVGTISGITDSLRRKMTVLDSSGNPTLNPEYYGKVLAVNGQDFSSKNSRMSHCRALDWNIRIDKNMNDCILSREWLESQIL